MPKKPINLIIKQLLGVAALIALLTAVATWLLGPTFRAITILGGPVTSSPGGSVTSSPRPPPHPDFSAIDRILQSLPTGNIAFNVPSTMFLEETYGIRLLLSPAKSVQELQEELQERMGTEETLEGAEIRIAPWMQARLTGQGFEITAVKPETQLVSGEQETEWQWDVTPKRANTLRLHLTLSAILVVDGEPAPRTIRTFDKIIEVQVTWGQRITGFVGNNWQWLWAAILVPIAGWLWRKRKKKTPA